jgi:hypothetical protein
MKLTALQSFSQRGAKIIRQGDTFTASEADAEIYIRNGMASLYEESEAPSEITELRADGAPVEATETQSIYLEEDLQEKNVTDLRKIAKNKGVSGYTRMTKSELIFAILASQQGEQLQQMEE